MNSKPRKRTPFLQLSPADRDKVVSSFEQGISYDRTRPLSEKGKLLWARAKRGRPKVGKGARRVLITLEGGLLQKTDCAAKRCGKNRSQFISVALRSALRCCVS